MLDSFFVRICLICKASIFMGHLLTKMLKKESQVIVIIDK